MLLKISMKKRNFHKKIANLDQRWKCNKIRKNRNAIRELNHSLSSYINKTDTAALEKQIINQDAIPA